VKLGIKDTIAAISTPPGENGIGIIRMSGPSALKIADEIFLSKDKPSELGSHTLHYGHIGADGKKIDEALLAIMRKPRTYTREDVVEINCHSGIVTLKQILDLVVSHGARIAEPGEFTKRAFLNGRIDLVQAEAVLDIISSRTSDSLKIAERQLRGEVSARIKAIRSSLIDIISEIEADINFPDEGLAVSEPLSLKRSLCRAERELLNLIDSSDKGVILREGITTVICGKPNVGKSSLMNNFLRQDRVIVTPIPGTTRDAIEEMVDVKGIPLRIVDTAGIIHIEDEVTKESVERSKHYMRIADLILLVLDSSDKLNKQDIEIIDIVKDKKTLVVVNKTDLPEVLQIDEIKSHLHNKEIIKVSAKQRSGLETLENAIYNIFWSGDVTTDTISISNSRHLEALRKALNSTKGALKVADEGGDWEILSLNVKDAIEALGLITGEVFTDDLLDTIFSKFCVGK